LLPVDDVDYTRVSSDEFLQKLLKAYDVPGSGAGAVAHLTGEAIGAPVSDRASIERLRWALVYGTLAAGSPRKGRDAPRATADNALLWAHPSGDSSFTAIEEGGLSSILKSISLTDGEIGQIPRPEGLAVIHGSLPDLDDERVTALYEEMAKGLILGRRLQRTLEWLNFAWTNTVSITEDARIVALRTAYEALLSTRRNSKTEFIRTRLSRLLTPRAPKTRRAYKNRGRRKDEKLTDIAWWFQSFTMLRNEIIHGDDIHRHSRVFGSHDESHVMLASKHLLELVPRKLVKAGHPADLLEHKRLRKMMKAAEGARGHQGGRS
jgi:hypothetical protein